VRSVSRDTCGPMGRCTVLTTGCSGSAVQEHINGGRFGTAPNCLHRRHRRATRDVATEEIIFCCRGQQRSSTYRLMFDIPPDVNDAAKLISLLADLSVLTAAVYRGASFCAGDAHALASLLLPLLDRSSLQRLDFTRSGACSRCIAYPDTGPAFRSALPNRCPRQSWPSKRHGSRHRDVHSQCARRGLRSASICSSIPNAAQAVCSPVQVSCQCHDCMQRHADCMCFQRP
jgi:hypothetical protein